MCLFLRRRLLTKSDWVTAVDFKNDPTSEKNHSMLALEGFRSASCTTGPRPENWRHRVRLLRDPQN